MDQLIQIMFPPFVACMLLTGICSYLGLHVVSREVIFVDLALAQIAALGTTFAFLMGFEADSNTGYFYSLGFTFLGAVIFSISRLRDQRVPQEALIGIVFAVSSSAAILIADQASQGAEHVTEMLTGSILWVSWATIGRTLIICVAVGTFHFIFRRQFLLISLQSEEALRQGLRIRWWDFLFYVSFGFVITSSVAIAGVLLVFCFLIIPSVIGMLFSRDTRTRLILAWVSGAFASSIGLLVSYQFDLPSGPSIVCMFGVFLVLAALIQYLSKAAHRGMALVRVGIGLLVVGIVGTLLLLNRPAVESHSNVELTDMERVLEQFGELAAGAPSASILDDLLGIQLDLVEQGLREGRIQPDQQLIQRLGENGLPDALPLLRLICDNSEDPWSRYYGSLSILKLGDITGIHRLIQILTDPGPVFLKATVNEFLMNVTGKDFGYQPMNGAEETESSVHRWESWWHENAESALWDSALGQLSIR
ncbi:MAG: metal ABC transporter permease [Acidobacteriota bacterium]